MTSKWRPNDVRRRVAYRVALMELYSGRRRRVMNRLVAGMLLIQHRSRDRWPPSPLPPPHPRANPDAPAIRYWNETHIIDVDRFEDADLSFTPDELIIPPDDGWPLPSPPAASHLPLPPATPVESSRFSTGIEWTTRNSNLNESIGPFRISGCYADKPANKYE